MKFWTYEKKDFLLLISCLAFFYFSPVWCLSEKTFFVERIPWSKFLFTLRIQNNIQKKKKFFCMKKQTRNALFSTYFFQLPCRFFQLVNSDFRDEPQQQTRDVPRRRRQRHHQSHLWSRPGRCGSGTPTWTKRVGQPWRLWKCNWRSDGLKFKIIDK